MSPEPLLWLLAGLLGAALLHGFARPERFYEYPWFMAAVMAVFILPQAISLVRFPGEAAAPWVAATLGMAIACLLACFVGYRVVRPPSQWRRAAGSHDPTRLLAGAALFLAVAWFFNWKLGGMSAEDRGGSMWTGVATIYHFFTLLTFPALAIALTVAMRTRWVVAWLVTALATIGPAQAALLWGRREVMAQLAFSVAVVLFLERGIRPPRLALAAATVGAMLLIPATDSYRSALHEGPLKALAETSWVENFRQFVSYAEILELRNAALLMQATAETGTYELGAGYWDQIVFRFVPGQLVGHDLKQALMLGRDDERLAEQIADRGYAMPTGSTVTGIGDSFRQLGWLGFLFFLILGLFMRQLWSRAQHADDLWARLLYLTTATSAMRAVTHQTIDYLPGLLYNLIVLGLLMAVTRVRQPDGSAATTRPAGPPRRVATPAPRRS